MSSAASFGKVFGLGLARTGTTSMHQAMLMLGVRSAPESTALLDHLDPDFLARYDAFFDNPVPFRYRSLDALYPQASYIVTHRPRDTWLSSMQYLFGPGLDRLDVQTRELGDRVHREVYGIDRFDADVLSAIHEQHYEQVRSFVVGKPHIWLELEDGFEWTPICDLLGLPVPRRRFPHTNRSVRRWRR